jgi:glycosyltransferase involved in cell wall biosynthesis
VSCVSAAPELTIVVPCRNEAANLQDLVERLHRALAGASPYRVVVVDDGSTDGTWEVAAQLGAGGAPISVIRLSRPFGKESAILAGLAEASTELVAIMDGDLQHPPEVLAEMLRVQAVTGADQVVGVRARSGEGRVRSVFSRTYARALSRVSDVPLSPGEGDFRVATRRVVEAVLNLTEVNRFNRGLFAWVGFSSVQVDYADAERSAGPSRWGSGQLVGYGLDGLLSFSPKPLRFLIGLGTLSMAIFLAYIVIVIVRIVILGVETPGYATLIAAVFFVAGMQAFSAGLLGEYLGRIFLEVKNRPAYVVMERHVGGRQA